MIFASDLDRTLIYSKKLISDIDYDNGEIVLAEKYNGKDLSFMKKDVVDKLKSMKKNIIFIPVTTRTIEQYNRIFMISEYIKPKYAVVSNGGNILIDGEIDEEWNAVIKEKVSRSLHYKFVEKRFLESFSDISWINKMILRDELFFSVHFDDNTKINLKELKEFETWIKRNGWQVSLQGRKLYLVPKDVNKWDAVLYIKEKLGKNKVISAGDSFLDYPILSNADYGMCASHGELIELINNNVVSKKNIYFTKNKGIDASGEILDNIVELVEN